MVSGALERRASPENPNTNLSDPAEWLFTALGGEKAASGIRVSPEEALEWTAVSAGIRIISGLIASLPFKVFEQLDRGKRVAGSHPVHPIIRRRPNPEMTAFEFWELLPTHTMMFGTSYAEIVRDGAGRVSQLWPLHPDRVKPERDDSDRLFFRVTLPKKVRDDGRRSVVDIPEEDMLRVPGFSTDGLLGKSLMRLHKDAIGLGIATERFASKYFERGASPSGVLETDNQLSDAAWQRLRDSGEIIYEGLDNAHRIAILEEGLEWKQITVDPEKSQLQGGRTFQVREASRILGGLPPHLLGDLADATFCLPPDELVYTEHGPRPIAEVEKGDQVWSYDTEEESWSLRSVERAGCTGADKILTIRCQGRTLRCNGRHPIRVWRETLMPYEGGRGTYIEKDGGKYRRGWEAGWLRADEVSPGDYVLAAEGGFETAGECPTRDVLTEEFMEVCGMVTGDGFFFHSSPSHTENVYHAGFGFSHPEESSYLDHYIQVVQASFDQYTGPYGSRADERQRITHSRRDATTTVFWSAAAHEELDQLGLTGTAHTKRVPDWMFGLPAHLKLAYLRGYLDADGTVDKRGRTRWASCNRQLMEDVRHLCMSVGLPVGNIYESERTSSFDGYEASVSTLYGVAVCRPEAAQRIGSHTDLYRERWQSVIDGRHERTTPVPTAIKCKRACPEGTRACHVDSVEISDGEEPVYDLCVEGNHTFIAAGVLVHNSNVEQQNRSLLTFQLNPWLRRIQNRVQVSLFGDSEQGRFFAEHVTEELLRPDAQARAELYQARFQTASISPNDIREVENENPVDGGDEPFAPLNMIPLSQALELSPEQRARLLEAESGAAEPRQQTGAERAPETDTHGAVNGRLALINDFTPAFVDAAERMVRGEVRNIDRFVSEFLEQEDVSGFNRQLERYYFEDHPEFATQVLAPLFASFARAAVRTAKEGVDAEPVAEEVERFVQEYTESFTARYSARSRKKLLADVNRAVEENTDPAPVVRARLERWENGTEDTKSRAEQVAQDEPHRLDNAVAVLTFGAAGVTVLRWQTVGKNCPLCERLNGTVVGVRKPFVSEGDTILGTDDETTITVNSNISHPPLHQGCDCRVVPGPG